jgi:cytochrome c biogenesis protein CcmG/thiol:disulfide interchange protein DsbE
MQSGSVSSARTRVGRWPRRPLPLIVICLGAALLALLGYGLANQSTSRTLDDALAHGQHPLAPSLTLPALTGSGSSSVAAYRGRVVVLNIWASWCQPCQAEAPLLERAERSLSAHGGTVLGVTYRDAAPDSVSFARHYALSYPQLRDVDGKLAQAYGTAALPESFVIDRSGRVVAISRGEVDQGFLDRAVALASAT